MKRPSGWQRLGIVVSLTWLLCSFAGLRWVQYQQSEQFAQGSVNWCANSRTSDDWQKNFNRCWEENAPLRRVPIYWPPLFFFSLAPIPLFWFAGWAGIKTVRWVRAGFQ